MKFGIFDVSHGCTRPLVAKYFTQPTYGRKMSGLSPAWIFASASDSFVMYVNCGLFAGCCFTYCANIACPPSLPYPAQSSTCSLPDSAVANVRIASATPVRPATTPAPPTAPASRSRVCRSNRRSISLPSSSSVD